MNTVDVSRIKANIAFFTTSKMRKTVVHAQNVPAVTIRRIGNRADNRVNAGRRSAATNYSNYISYTDSCLLLSENFLRVKIFYP